MKPQLSLFDTAHDLAEQVCASMLESMNEGRKQAEKFFVWKKYNIEGIWCYVVRNKQGDLYCNAFTQDGETPDGWSANFRLPYMLKEDFKTKHNTR